MNHMSYMAMIGLARRFWMQKHAERIKKYKKFLKRVITHKMDCHDWLWLLVSD